MGWPSMSRSFATRSTSVMLDDSPRKKLHALEPQDEALISGRVTHIEVCRVGLGKRCKRMWSSGALHDCVFDCTNAAPCLQ
jgi:hypothetical protein